MVHGTGESGGMCPRHFPLYVLGDVAWKAQYTTYGGRALKSGDFGFAITILFFH